MLRNEGSREGWIYIFLNFSVIKLNKSISQKLRRIYGSDHLAIILRVVIIFLNFCSKELRFGFHADSIVLMNFVYILSYIEG